MASEAPLVGLAYFLDGNGIGFFEGTRTKSCYNFIWDSYIQPCNRNFTLVLGKTEAQKIILI